MKSGRKDPSAVKLGRKGGQSRAKNMTAKQRSEAARKASLARWAKDPKSGMDTSEIRGKRKGSKSWQK